MNADQDIKFKVNTLIIRCFTSDKVHILDWLLIKSPNLFDLQIDIYSFNCNFNRGLEI